MTAMRLEAADVLVADVIEMGDPPGPFRIVGCFPDRFILFDLSDRTELPLSVLPLEDFEADRTIRLVDAAPFNASVDEAALSDERRERRRVSHAMISPLIALRDRLFDEKARTKAISLIVNPKAPEGSDEVPRGPDRKTVKVTLDRWFRFGMTETAAMPSFVGIGGKGVRKTRGDKKLGRPRKYGSQPGTNTTDELIRDVMRGLRRYYLKNRKINFEKAREMILRDYCMMASFDPDKGKIVHGAKQLYAEQGFLSTRQVRYIYTTCMDEFEFKRERVGRRKYDRDMRGTTGNAASRAPGPGSRFEIDATIANIYVVSELEPSIVVGRPVIYLVIDVFSKMVVGLYVGLEGPSWTGAMMALVNMVTNKREFCAEYGIVIDEDEWPCHHLPEKLLGDRGEIAHRVIENLQANRHVTVESPQAYRPDWKGSVEKMFDLVDCELAPYTDSYVEPDFGERGGKNYVLEASWTVHDVTAAMIDTILRLNNHRTIDGYKRPREMIADNVDAVPIHMWDWGIARRSGRLRRATPQQVAFDVMPREQVSVRPDGISFRGLRYTCEMMIADRWTDRARARGAWKETVSFDPRSARYVYLHVSKDVDPRGYVPCRLTDSYRQYEAFSFAEVAKTLRAAKDRAADRSTGEVEEAANSATRLERIEQRSKKRLGDLKRKPSDVADRRGAFEEEKAAARRREALNLVGEIDESQSAEVTPLHSEQDDDVSEPSIFTLRPAKRNG